MKLRRDLAWLLILLAVAALFGALWRPAGKPPAPARPAPTRPPRRTEAPSPPPRRVVELQGGWSLEQFLEAARRQNPELSERAREVWKQAGSLAELGELGALASQPRFSQGDVQEVHEGFLVCDGNVKASFLHDSVIVATGRVTIAHSGHCLVICGGRLEISHDSHGTAPSLILCNDFAEISHANGTVVAARGGLNLGHAHRPVTLVNTEAQARPNLVYLDAPGWLYDMQTLHAEPAPEGQVQDLPRNLPVHGVIVYESALADHTVTVKVDKPAVLVLSSYDEVVWRVVGPVRGVLVGGYHPSAVEGLGKDVPLVSRWGGEFCLYQEKRDRAGLEAAVQALLGVKPATVQEDYAGQSFQIPQR